MVYSINGSCWSRAKEFLESSWALDAHVVCMQELKIVSDDSHRSASEWAASHGWDLIINRGKITDSDGASGGVGIAVRQGFDFGIVMLPLPNVIISDHRAIAIELTLPNKDSIIVYCTYFVDKVRLNEENLGLLAGAAVLQ